MTNEVFNVDPNLRAGFIDDSLEELAGLDNLFLDLEAAPENLDVINAIFRPVHSIKGNSSFFGLTKVKKLSHEMETLLDLARKEQLQPTRPVIDALLAGVDQLKEMFARVRDEGNEIGDEGQFNELVHRIISARKANDDITALQVLNMLEKLEKDCAELETQHVEQLDRIIGMVSRLMKNGAAGDDWQPQDQGEIPDSVQELGSILARGCDRVLDHAESTGVLKHLTALKELAGSPETHRILDTAIDEYHTMVDTVGFDSLLCELLQEKMDTLAALGRWDAQTDAGANTSAGGQAGGAALQESSQPAKSAGGSQKTMRILEESVDDFLGYVGELIGVDEMYRHLQRKMLNSGYNRDLTAEFRRINENFSALSDKLQRSVMEIRKVPVRVILQKVPRIVRDIAAGSGKDISVELAGQDVKIDKSLIETIDGPLVHMVRNAADHGIEMPDEREKLGKPSRGTLCVAVSETADDITLTVSDDGKGLDLEGIRLKAVQLGMVEPQHELTQDEITDLIFLSGVSTVKNITEVSGRGVGMDVVKRNVEAANGKIAVDSKPGGGTQCSMTLPKTVTTQIIDGMVVRQGSDRYVIPMDAVHEVFLPDIQGIGSVAGRGEYVHRHGELLPVVRLAAVLGDSRPPDQRHVDGIMVSTCIGKNRTAICVDDVVGVQQVVLKKLDRLRLQWRLYSAAAVMGDGTVAMVLNIDSVAQTTS